MRDLSVYRNKTGSALGLSRLAEAALSAAVGAARSVSMDQGWENESIDEQDCGSED